jgi:hypothetical protein
VGFNFFVRIRGTWNGFMGYCVMVDGTREWSGRCWIDVALHGLLMSCVILMSLFE